MDLLVTHADHEWCYGRGVHRMRTCPLVPDAAGTRPEVLAALTAAAAAAEAAYQRGRAARRRSLRELGRRRPALADPATSEPTCSLRAVAPPWQWTWAPAFVEFSEMELTW
jgi:hypothetical protein